MTGAILIKFVAKTISASKSGWHTAVAATASVAESLAPACRSTLVIDLRRLKDAHLKRLEAKTRSEEAEARKKTIEASEAANKISERSHAETMSRLDIEMKQLEVRKRKAEAEEKESKTTRSLAQDRLATRVYETLTEHIEAVRKQNFDAKQQVLFDALLKLEREGGGLYVDMEQLKALQAPAGAKSPKRPSA